ncbi:F0F1 ATP synthase subunit B [Streptococcus marimammalium]|uniref:F0F1 ATP synthase subunit B n=1 Tax=Streptococcus marimammalium TaxID=269666 RepID=UPI00035ED944|nr:F0F1 ATP synthase subunit B [Streptococcus marimammalium]
MYILSTVGINILIGNFIIVTGSFLILLVLIKKFAWGKLLAIFEEREKRISNDIDSAEHAKVRAEKLANKREVALNEAKREANKIIDNAKEISHEQGNKIISEAKETADLIKDKAHQDIVREKEEALTSIKSEVTHLTILLAEKFLNEHLDESSKSQLVNDYLDKLGEA